MAPATSDPRLVRGAHIHALATGVLKPSIAKNHFGISFHKTNVYVLRNTIKMLLSGTISVLMATVPMVFNFVLEIMAAVTRPVTGYCSHVRHFDRT